MVSPRFESKEDFEGFLAKRKELEAEREQLLLPIKTQLGIIDKTLRGMTGRLEDAIAESLWGPHTTGSYISYVYHRDDEKTFYIEYNDDYGGGHDETFSETILWGETPKQREDRLRAEKAAEKERQKQAAREAKEALKQKALSLGLSEEELMNLMH